MGSNNPQLQDKDEFRAAYPGIIDNDGNIINPLPTFTTEEFITLVGNWKFKGKGDAEPVEYIDGVSITLDFNNNMENLQGLFQEEAIDKSLGIFNITGTINQYVKDGKLYNLAKQGESGELYITVKSDKDDTEYTFILKINFDNSTMSGDNQLQYALPFTTYGEDRFMLRKKVKKDEVVIPDVPVSGVSLNKNTLTLVEGNSEQLTAAVSPNNAANKAVEWTSDDSDTATVDQDGNVLAIAQGTATITVKTDDGGFEDTCEVTVEEN